MVCANCGKPLRTPRRLKNFCTYACQGQHEVQKAIAAHSGLVCSKNIKQNKALRSLRRRSVGAIVFSKMNDVTIRVDSPRKKAAGWLMEVAWPGVARKRWIVRVGDRSSEPLPLAAAKQTALAFFRQRRKIEPRTHHNHIVVLNQIAAYEFDHAAIERDRRRWPIDLMNGRRRGFVEQRAAIIEAELATSTEGRSRLQSADFPLDYYADGYPRLPECLRRTLEEVRFSDAA